MSAGNHAQGVAYHARRLGIPATIVMPPSHAVREGREHASPGRPRAARRAKAWTRRRCGRTPWPRREGLTFVHPFDDEAVIAGQGTMALEMLAAAPDLEVLIVPIGGGGLIAGIATAAKAMKPGIEIVGVEAALYPSVERRLRGAAGTGRWAHHRRGHRRQGAGRPDPADHRASRRRRAAGRGGGDRGRDPAPARDREDGGRGCRCRRPRRADELSRALPRPQGRPRRLRRQHRQPAAVAPSSCAASSAPSAWCACASACRTARAAWSGSPASSPSAAATWSTWPPAGLLQALGQARRRRLHDRDARRRATRTRSPPPLPRPASRRTSSGPATARGLDLE